MLKSRFNIAKQPDPESREEEETMPEQAAEPEQLVEETTPEEEKIVLNERPLLATEIGSRLSVLGKTAEGDGYTYLKGTFTGLSLTKLDAIKSYKHLQFVDVSDNQLTIEALQTLTELPFLVLIHADKNLLTSAALKRMKYLQVIIMNYNMITSVDDVFQPELSTLEVGYNKISKIHFDHKMPTVRCLDFRYNLLQDIANLDFPNLDSLYLAGNKITSLVGLGKLVNLRVLHLRHNPIRWLDGFESTLTKLQYVNLRNCKIGTLRQVRKLQVLQALDALILKGCPLLGGTGEETKESAAEEEEPEVRIEILATLPKLKRLNKGHYTSEERKEATDLIMQWLEDGEKNEDEEVEEIANSEEEEVEE